MSNSARKLNFMISEEVADELEKLVPAGKRSRVVNEAIRKELERLRREKLTEQLHALRETGPIYKAAEIAEDLRKDRKRDGMKPIMVPDASVSLKWVLKSDEEHGKKAIALLSAWVAGEAEILLPSLWVYEVGNIVGRKSDERAGEIMELLLDYRFPEAKIDAGHLLRSST